jgi:signal transduction histidine kinase
LQQVFVNLLANAVQHGASPDGARVRVHAERANAVLEVIDHGPGVPTEDRERIFERFYQSGERGTGLGVGLYLVHAIVTTHGGTVQVESDKGRGTSFIVRLPRLVAVT